MAADQSERSIVLSDLLNRVELFNLLISTDA